jgi:radical SAM protein with 4Fe4S-binding SPASM domain
MPNGGVFNRFKLFRDYLLRRTACSGKPVEISIETTTKCNLRCPMCTREQLVPALTDMSYDLFKRIIDQGQNYLELVVPMNLGEPLMNPRIYEIIRYCKSKGLSVLISTNGTLLNENNSRRLLESGVDYLIFSFDGATKDSYEKYRAGADYDKVRANLLSFFRMKRELKSHTHCVIQMVVLKDNQSEINAFKALWETEDVEVRFKPNLVLGEEFSIPRTLDGNPAMLKKPCFHLWRGSFVVRVDGVVFPCCWSYNTLPVGDLRTQTLDEIWNSPEMVALRKTHAAGMADQIPTCQNCSLVNPEFTSIAAAFLLTGPQVRRLLPLREKIVAFFEKLRPQK